MTDRERTGSNQYTNSPAPYNVECLSDIPRSRYSCLRVFAGNYKNRKNGTFLIKNGLCIPWIIEYNKNI
ncbi:hypothetical protein BRYFOR_09581 [Marvinbryantia formatexigens DSM 14469]|uniref:Uncharacterized protein n=1 Tax=Marvinbryantia formatexigens DSM 14469 TaxID=478749 RepID=C6LLN3_9FIRM|nr:hypothetical protein BRYFOR_09581 [Marvinbryantia formatexigens DSM 14469]